VHAHDAFVVSDPRLLCVGAVCVALVILAIRTWAAHGVLAGGVALLYVAPIRARGRLPSGMFLRGGLALIAATILLNTLLTPGPRLVASWPAWIPLSRPGFFGGLFAAARVAELSAVGLLVAARVAPEEIADVTGALLRPLGRLPGLRGLDMTVSLAIASVGLLAEEARDLALAARFRGRRARGWRARLDEARSLAAPLFVGTIRRAETTALALELRGYVPGRPRTRLTTYRTEPRAMALAAACAVWLVLVMIVDHATRSPHSMVS
jgi:energy-coupling factor transport system permease protein